MDRMFELPDGFVSLGWYPPTEARHLLDSLAEAGVEVHADFDDGISGRPPLEQLFSGLGVSASASVLVAVAASQMPMCAPILRDVLGPWLPDEVEHELREHEAAATGGGDDFQVPTEKNAAIHQLRDSLLKLNAKIEALEQELVEAPADQLPALEEAIKNALLQVEQKFRLLDQLSSET